MLKDVVRKETSVTTTQQESPQYASPWGSEKEQVWYLWNTQEFISEGIHKHREHSEYLALEQD